MFQTDISYYERRLIEERLQLEIADSTDTAAFHGKMVYLYEARIESLQSLGHRENLAHSERAGGKLDRATWSAIFAKQYSILSGVTEPDRASITPASQAAHVMTQR